MSKSSCCNAEIKTRKYGKWASICSYCKHQVNTNGDRLYPEEKTSIQTSEIEGRDYVEIPVAVSECTSTDVVDQNCGNLSDKDASRLALQDGAN